MENWRYLNFLLFLRRDLTFPATSFLLEIPLKESLLAMLAEIEITFKGDVNYHDGMPSCSISGEHPNAFHIIKSYRGLYSRFRQSSAGTEGSMPLPVALIDDEMVLGWCFLSCLSILGVDPLESALFLEFMASDSTPPFLTGVLCSCILLALESTIIGRANAYLSHVQPHTLALINRRFQELSETHHLLCALRSALAMHLPLVMVIVGLKCFTRTHNLSYNTIENAGNLIHSSSSVDAGRDCDDLITQIMRMFAF